MAKYLLDTHSLIFWVGQTSVSEEYISFFDDQQKHSNVYVSPITFWEIALLIKKGRINIEDVTTWKEELFKNTSIQLIDPTAEEMILSTSLPDIHKDPFDRLLIAQAQNNGMKLVTKDQLIVKYDVEVFWIN